MARQAPLEEEDESRRALEALEGALALGAAGAAVEAGLLYWVPAPRAVVLTIIALYSVIRNAILTYRGLNANFAFEGTLQAKCSDSKKSRPATFQAGPVSHVIIIVVRAC